MPDILIRQANIASGATVRPFDDENWRFRRCPYARGLYTVLVSQSGAAGVMEHAVLIGTTEVVQRSTTTIGTDGVIPVPQTTPAHQFYANKDDEVILELYEVGAVATTDVMVWANVEPA